MKTPEELKAKAHQYYLNHKEHIQEYNRNYRANHKMTEEQRARDNLRRRKRYFEREEVRRMQSESHKRWYQKHKLKQNNSKEE